MILSRHPCRISSSKAEISRGHAGSNKNWEETRQQLENPTRNVEEDIQEEGMSLAFHTSEEFWFRAD